MRHRRFVGELRPRQIRKARGAEIDEWPRAGHRGAGAERGDAGLRGRRIDHPAGEIPADPIQQLPLGTQAQHVAANDARPRIGAQAVVKRLDEGRRVCRCSAHDVVAGKHVGERRFGFRERARKRLLDGAL